MKTIIKLSAILFLALSLNTACKKYEDGPKISLASKKSRLCGDWKIQNITVNGTDVTAATQAVLGANYVVDIEKDGSYKIQGAFPDQGKWELGEDKDDVYFTSNTPGSLENANRILRLKQKELWLRHTGFNGDVTITKYEPAD